MPEVVIYNVIVQNVPGLGTTVPYYIKMLSSIKQTMNVGVVKASRHGAKPFLEPVT